ncbi:MAG: class I SAM-dependent methyltransferase [Chloroflexi bacterium]|nr:class I SAM-dependent methyltransferase [Chloroflexota bacterium]
METIYNDYAKVYDASGQLAFSLRMIPYLGKLLERHPARGKVLLELACGTGTTAIGLAEAGWRVYGVDGSPQMLAQARAKAEGLNLDVHWSCQDMRRFFLPERVYLATCLYDSMNYMLTSEDLFTVFRQVYRALMPGGLFLFDMNTAYALSTLWNDTTYFTDSPDLSVVMRSIYDERQQRSTVVVTCFQRVNELYRKIVERHTEQAYPPEQIATLLLDAGFRLEASYDCFSFERPKLTTLRIMWVARKPEQDLGAHL